MSRHLAVRRFSAWLTEEGEQGSRPLLGLGAPKLDKPVVEPLSDDQFRALLKACCGVQEWLPAERLTPVRSRPLPRLSRQPREGLEVGVPPGGRHSAGGRS